MSVSAVIVAYRSAEHLPALLASLEDVDEAVVVDHSEDPAEAATLERLRIDRLVVQANRGYGAGLNRGVRESVGDQLLLLNPDVVLLPGATRALLAALDDPGVAAAGPRLQWDPAGRWLLPHSPPLTWQDELRAALAPRSATRAYLAHELRLWTAAEPVATPVIGGAAMAVTRDTFVASGGFDERFFLFYEENDWCRRLTATGKRILVAPGARVVHPYGRSIGAAAAEHFTRSEALYRRLWLPRWYLRLFPHSPRARVPDWPHADPAGLRPGDRLLLGHTRRFVPAALGVWREGDRDPAALLPTHADAAPYQLCVQRNGSVQSLGSVTRRHSREQ